MTTRTASRLMHPVSARDHLRGPADAPVTLLEYADFECPYCGQAYYIVKELERLYPDDLRVAFRHFPLTTIHPRAEQAAEAAEAAGAQGQFWEMHDLLFENQPAFDEGRLLEYAAELGLDVTRFSRDVAERQHAARIREDVLSGMRSGVNGTPTFFINGMRHDGAYDLESLAAAVEDRAVEEQEG